MEQTTPQPTRPVMDVARPRPTAPIAPRTAVSAPAPAKPAAQPQPTPSVPQDTAPEPPKSPEHQPEAPKVTLAPQALAVHQAPADDGDEKTTESAPAEPVTEDGAAAAEEQAHQESTVSAGPHAPVGVIVVTVLAMIVLCALATMIYFDTQK